MVKIAMHAMPFGAYLTDVASFLGINVFARTPRSPVALLEGVIEVLVAVAAADRVSDGRAVVVASAVRDGANSRPGPTMTVYRCCSATKVLIGRSLPVTREPAR